MEEQQSINRSVLVIVFLCIAAFAFVLIYIVQTDQRINQKSNKEIEMMPNEPTAVNQQDEAEEQRNVKQTPAVVNVTPKDNVDIVIEDITKFSDTELELTASEDTEIDNAGTVNTSGYLQTYDETKF